MASLTFVQLYIRTADDHYQAIRVLYLRPADPRQAEPEPTTRAQLADDAHARYVRRLTDR